MKLVGIDERNATETSHRALSRSSARRLHWRIRPHAFLDEDAVDGARAIDAEEIRVLRADGVRQVGDRLRNRVLFEIAIFDHQIVASLRDRIDSV